jgi:replicative DNA helicase
MGDEVFANDGSVTRVIWRSQVWRDRPVYRVETLDGDHIVADADHLWKAELAQDRRPGLYTTERVAGNRQRARVRLPMPIELPTAQLPIDPFTFGAWLGDGCGRRGQITGCGDDLRHIRRGVEAAGYRTTEFRDGKGFGVPGLITTIKKVGCFRNKHIPPTYLRSASGQRLALLQGLIDTDGHVSPIGQVEFCTTLGVLADGVQELVASLGGKASRFADRAVFRGKDCGPRFRVHFFMPDAASIPRKAARCRAGVRTPDRYIRAIRAGQADIVCIRVVHDSGMFLVGRSMLPTHNSALNMRESPARAGAASDRA